MSTQVLTNTNAVNNKVAVLTTAEFIVSLRAMPSSIIIEGSSVVLLSNEQMFDKITNSMCDDSPLSYVKESPLLRKIFISTHTLNMWDLITKAEYGSVIYSRYDWEDTNTIYCYFRVMGKWLRLSQN